MQRLAFFVSVVACVAPALAQDAGPLFDQLASKDEAEAQAAHEQLVALGEGVVAEVERRLAKKPGERIAARLRAVLGAIQSGDLEALFTPRLELPDASTTPAVISPDGKHVAYAARVEKDEALRYEFRVATLTDDGKLKVKTVHECAESIRDDFVVPALMPGCWSPDSRYLGYVDGLEGGGRKDTVVGYVDIQSGKTTQLGGAAGEVCIGVRFHPKGGTVTWMSLVPGGPSMSGEAKVRELKSGKTTTLGFPETFAPVDLRYLDDGSALVLGAVIEEPMKRPAGGVYWVSADGKTVREISADFSPDDFFWDGPPSAVHGPGAPFMLCESRSETGGKRPTKLLLFGADAKQAKVLVAESYHSLVGLIDSKRASVWAQEKGEAGVLNLETGEITPLEHKRLVLHRRGKRTVILDMETHKLSVN